MTYEITTISTKKFLLITLLSIPFIFFISIGLGVILHIKLFAFLVLPLLAFIIFLGHRLASDMSVIKVDNSEYFKIDNEKIEYQNIVGFFLNDTGLTQSALSLRLNTNKSVHIISTKFGDKGKYFYDFRNELVDTIKNKNPNIKELEYQDIYVKQSNIMRPILIGLAIIILIMDLIAVFISLTKRVHLPYQIFFVNIILLGLIPYMKKRKN